MVASGGLPAVCVREWAAWAPGLADQAQWQAFLRNPGEIPSDGSPEAGFIAPLLRRRMSRLNRMALTTAFSCCREAAIPCDQVRLVLASRHGDMPVTVRLLEQLSRQETLSPADFTNSVHHAAAGYWGITSANRQAARAVAGGEASFCYGWLDAVGLLARQPGAPVLLVAADDVLPAPFAALVRGRNAPYSVALLLKTTAGPDSPKVSLRLRAPGPEDRGARRGGPLGIPALDFLRWYLGRAEGELTLELGQRIWQWTS